MKIDEAILKFISDKAGCDITTPSGAAFLRDDIESVTGERLSLNTIKRLVGAIQFTNTPRKVTLDILGRYAGCDSWDNLVMTVNDSISNFSNENQFIDMSTLRLNSEVEINWSPDRTIIIKHVGNGSYKVVSAVNSKLMAGDELSLSQLAKGFPFMAKQVVRSGIVIGPYTAALKLGIRSIKIKS